MKIAICDDEATDREIIKCFIRTHSQSHEIKEYSSALPLLEHINTNNCFDLIFLDIQMPDSDGWGSFRATKEIPSRYLYFFGFH